MLTELEKQVLLACKGVSKPICECQTDTGVKDAYTQYWIDYLIDRFAQLKKLHGGRKTDEEIEAELIEWTLVNKEKIYSPFLTTTGEA